MDKRYDTEIGATGKRPNRPGARRGSVAIARGRSANGGSFGGVALDPRTEQLAQTSFDLRVEGGALALAPRAQRNDRFGHVAMAAGAADIGEQIFHRLAGVLAGHAVVAHADHELAAELAGDRDPGHALELQAEIRHLHDQVVALDGAEIEHDEPILAAHT